MLLLLRTLLSVSILIIYILITYPSAIRTSLFDYSLFRYWTNSTVITWTLRLRIPRDFSVRDIASEISVERNKAGPVHPVSRVECS